MKTLGLLGGMSWESTREYYRILNESVRHAKGGLHSAPVLLYSFDFAPIAQMQARGEWDALERELMIAARQLERSGADAILICTNYMHRCAEAVENAVSVPLIHIADCIAEAIQVRGQKTVGLLGACGTMKHPFYRERLEAKDIRVLIPDAQERAEIHRVIFEELCQGCFSEVARKRYIAIIDRLANEGAEGMILGCTEIEQLIRPEHTDLTLYPSAEIHALAAAEYILSEKDASQAA